MSYAREDLRRFSAALAALSEGGRPDELALRLIRHLEHLFGAHMSAVNVLEDKNPVPRIVATYMMDLSHWTVQAFPQYAMDHPGVRFLANGGRAPVLRISDFITDRQFQETGLYREIFSFFGGEQQMTLMVPIPGEQWAFVLFRQRAFTDDDVHLLRQFQPHVARALIDAKRLGMPAAGAFTSANIGMGSDGFVLLAEDGTPRHISEVAARMIAKFFGPRSTATAWRLPDDLSRWISVNHRLMRSMSVNSVPGRNLIVPAVDGVLEIKMILDAGTGMFFLQLSQRSSGYDYGKMQAVGLTKRECEVLFWVAQGKRDSEVGLVLGITTKTVGKHMENIMGKLGSETRTGAVRVASELLAAQQ